MAKSAAMYAAGSHHGLWLSQPHSMTFVVAANYKRWQVATRALPDVIKMFSEKNIPCFAWFLSCSENSAAAWSLMLWLVTAFE